MSLTTSFLPRRLFHHRLMRCLRSAALVVAVSGATFCGPEALAAPPFTLSQVHEGIDTTFRRLRGADLYVEYRWESKPQVPNIEVGFPWAEIKFAMKNGTKLYCDHTAPHRQANGAHEVRSFRSAYDGDLSTNLNDGREGSILRDNVPVGVYWWDVYLQTLGFVLRPADREKAEGFSDEIYWLPYALAKRPYVVLDTPDLIDDASCVVLVAEGLDKLWLDPSRGFVLRQREMTLGPDQPLKFRIKNTAFRQVADNLWLPSQSVREDFPRPPAESHLLNKVVLLSTIQVTTLEIDRPLPDSLFKLQFPPGSQVFDGLRRVRYTVTKPGEDLLEASIQRAHAERAEPSDRGVPLWLVLLAGALAIGPILLWWLARRRHA